MVVERVLEKKKKKSVNERKFGFISEKGIIDVVSSLRRLQEEHHAKG